MAPESDLHALRRATLLLLAAVSIPGAILVGIAPGAWDRFGGLAVAFLVGYGLLRRVLGERLSAVRRWTLFAGFGTVCLGIVTVHASTTGATPSGDLLSSYALCLAVAGFSGYRAITAR
ncbi:hypothetical protein [Halobaculum lipolyticum]|uniref:Uncharacterized protein n=1 Tax=Halobaculum lipolyticum TaxID=3032001 RepID=A0ABD5WB03_9EURY|nr:hypothetical protein [Halobaculum sp. DT31]